MADERLQTEDEHPLDPTETWGQGRDESDSRQAGAPRSGEPSRDGPAATDETPDGLGGLREEPREPAPPRIEDQPEGRTDDAGSGTPSRQPPR